MLNNTFIDMLHAVASSCNRVTLEMKSIHEVTQKTLKTSCQLRIETRFLDCPARSPILFYRGWMCWFY